MITRRGLLKFLGTGFLGAAALGGYAFGVEPLLRLRVTRYKLSPPNWPRGLTLKIVALADIHACNPWMSAKRIGRICAQANGLGGDMIVLLGDYVSGMDLVSSHVESGEWSKSLATLEAPLGVHAIFGNHDYWEDKTFQQNGGGETFGHRALKSVGIPIYDNRALFMEKEGQGFWLAGLADQVALLPGRQYGRNRLTGLDDLPGTLDQVTNDDPIILMAHEPDIFPTVPDRVALTLCGHTHGGQVRLFGYSPVVPSRFGNRYAYGHVVEQNRNMIISAGLGCSILPVRFGSPPEIVVVDLG